MVRIISVTPELILYNTNTSKQRKPVGTQGERTF